MRIGLASYECKNNDLSFNLSQIERALEDVRGKADLVCFGEAFLQGFDCLRWDYETDRDTALEADSETMRLLCRWTERYGVGLLTGYIERDGESLYSSCAVLGDGALLHNYRRISRGWKEYWHTDAHYREGDTTGPFSFRGEAFVPVLCGDLWDFPARFRSACPLLWPVWVDFTVEEWEHGELDAYARQAALAAEHVLMVNPIDRDKQNHGGAFHFCRGRLLERLPFDQEGVLIVAPET